MAPGSEDPISIDDAAQRLERGEAILVDVRDAAAHDQAHAAPARSIPIDQLAARADELRDAPLVITSCGGGTRGPRAAAQLRELGIQSRALQGGLRAWRAAGLPVDESASS